jgi:hypothetical protein
MVSCAWGRHGGTRVMQALRGKPLPARRVGVPRTWKGFGHEKSSVSASDRCHHRYHCLGDIITSSGVAGWLACRSRRRSNCWYGDRWNSGRRPRPWPRLLLLPRTGRLLRSGYILRPMVLYGVSIRSVIARCDAEVRTTKVAERSAAFFAAHESLVGQLGPRAMSASAPLLGDKRTSRIYEYTP